MNSRIISCGSAILAISILTSCQLFDTAPAADSGFNRSTAQTKTRAAFLQQTWVARPYRGKAVREHFSSVYIAPVNTSYMKKQSWWQQQTNARQADLAKDTQDFAQRMRKQFMVDVADYPGKKIQIASAPGKGVLVIELALVELVPSNAYWIRHTTNQTERILS